MDTISGIFICPQCGTQNEISSISSDTLYSTWSAWQKRGNKWIIGCYGGYDKNDIWWWDVFKYFHGENGDKVCWEKFGGSTEEKWTKGHYKWRCMSCQHYSTTFTDFIKNIDELK